MSISVPPFARDLTGAMIAGAEGPCRRGAGSGLPIRGQGRRVLRLGVVTPDGDADPALRLSDSLS